jgi:cobalt-zinc-cadmium efflux system membrane fusion protein
MESKIAQHTRRVSAIAALAMLSLTTPVFGADTLKLAPAQMKALGVETAPLAARGGGELQGLAAQVVVPSRQLFIVAAPLAGLVEQLAVAPDAAVKKGALLARLQSPQLADIQRGLLQSATQLRLARDNLKRDKHLLDEGIIAASRYRTAQSQHAEASAALAERRQALKLAGMSQAAIDKLQAGRGLSGAIDIVAPAAGVVLEQMASAGQRVDAAAPLFKLAQLDPLWLEIQVPAARINEVAAQATVRVPAYAAAGQVLSIGRSVSANQTVLVRAEVSRGADKLRPGQWAEATIATSGGGANQWRVPNAALVRTQGKLLLLVQMPSGFRAEPVHLVSEGAASSVVSGELKGDERIAVRGVAALKAALAGIGGE